jgi:hypothetical protein
MTVVVCGWIYWDTYSGAINIAGIPMNQILCNYAITKNKILRA